jgi:uncharacterized protein YndB with AHSA1/START domain
MKWLYIAVGTIVGLVILVVAVGYALPVKHRASRERTFASAPERIYGIITAYGDYPEWRRGVQRVEIVVDPAGRTVFREVGDDETMSYIVEDDVAPRRVVTRIADPGLPFGGRWTYEITPAAAGTTLRIVEDGEVYNPVFRFVSRFIIGHHHTMDRYLEDLEARAQTSVRSTTRAPGG